MLLDVLAGAAASAVIVILAWRRPWRRRGDDRLVLETWLETFSLDGYLPMLRLAESSDAGFLSGYRGAEAAARYRHLQCQMLKEYLRSLSRDFHRLHILAVESPPREGRDGGNPSLAAVEEKMEFIFSMWSIELRLILNEVAPLAINLRPLLSNVDKVTARAREIARRRHDLRLL